MHKIVETTLDSATQVVAGKLYSVNGKPVVAPTNQTAAQWATAIGGSPTIKSIDLVGRSPGWLENVLD
jgi:hypothetical protein